MISTVFDKLKHLYDFVPTDAETLRRWYVDAAELVALLRSMPELADQVPIRVWQYLSDADIRMKDKDFAVSQNQILIAFMAGLKEGKVLSGEQIDELIGPQHKTKGN